MKIVPNNRSGICYSFFEVEELKESIIDFHCDTGWSGPGFSLLP